VQADSVIAVRGLSYAYAGGPAALDNLAFHLSAGESLGRSLAIAAVCRRWISVWAMLTLMASVGVFAGSCGQSPTRPTIVIQAPTPQLLGIFPGVQRELRPVLAVATAATLGPAGSVTYQFDIAVSPDFRSPRISGTVDQQEPQTMFAVPSDLVAGTTYFWRARTLRGEIASPYSVTQSFATITPASPGFVALQLYFNAGCRTFFGERELTVYGHLDKVGPDWRFTVPANANPSSLAVYDLVMNLAEAAGRLSGTIRGNAIDPVGFPVGIYDGSGLNVPALASGALSANGGAAGTFSGALPLTPTS
jgi:hypothetical protein